MGGNSRSKDEGADSRELDQNVDGWARGILERVSNGVTDDGGSVLTVSLLDEFTLVFLGVVALKLASFNEFLAVVPSTTRVGSGESNLNSRNNSSSKDTVGSLESEEPSHKERGDDDKASGVDHLLKGGFS